MGRPKSMDREEVARWLGRIFIETRGETRSSKQATLAQADAVLALVEAKVRFALPMSRTTWEDGKWNDDAVVAYVLRTPAPEAATKEGE